MSNLPQATDTAAMRKLKYIPTLDGWRAIAIAMVVLAHGSDSIINFLGVHAEYALPHQIGILGVQIFFGLSGFLITSRMISEEIQKGQISLQSFYFRRAFRILPAALTFLAVVGALAWMGVLPISLGRWLSTVFFFANYTTAEHSWYVGHFWSLAVEEHFYFAWPLTFLLLANTKRRLSAVTAFALFIALWRAVDYKFHVTGSSPEVFWGRTDIEADFIAWGVAFALLYRSERWSARLEMLLQQSIAIPVLAMTLLACVVAPDLNWKLSFLLLTVKAIAIPLLILAVLVHKSGATHTLLETRPMKLLGRLSFSIYLWQQLFLVWSSSMIVGMTPFQTFPINLIAVLICAALSLRFIEKPLIKFGHEFSNRLNARPSKPLHQPMLIKES